MIRLFVQAPLRSGDAVEVSQDQAHYLVNVMRQTIGAGVLLFNGRDGEWRATISEIGRRRCRLIPTDQARPQAVTPDVELIVAVVKRGRLETIAEKAAELGARRLRLALTDRTNADRVRIDRLQAIATEAAEQTGRLDVPVLEEPQKLARILDGWEGRRLLFCDEGGDARPVIEAAADPGPWSILIGPEGGFSPEERARLRGLPFVTAATLGPRILRADTAAISALTLWQAKLGDWAT